MTEIQQAINAVLTPDTRVGSIDDPRRRPPQGSNPLTMTLHSGEVIATTLGREPGPKKPAILGWSRAASHYISLLKAYINDNPFADMVLIIAENDLAARRQKIRTDTAAVKERHMQGMDPGLWSARQSLRMAVDTGNVHARALAGFIFEVDQLARLHKASVSTGDVTMTEVKQLIRELQRTIRQAIYLPIQWNSLLLPVTRAQVRSGSHEHLDTLAKKFGGMPREDIMLRKLQPQNVPFVANSKPSDRATTVVGVDQPQIPAKQSSGG